jgi:hypothetical protein
MDFRESLDDPEESFWTVLDGLRKRLWTALPVFPQTSADGNTTNAQVAVKGQITDQNGNVTEQVYPLLQTMPIAHYRAGGMAHTWNVTQGDEGMVLFASRPLDGWWHTGQQNQPTDTRLHSLSDGMFIPAGYSKPRALMQVSNNSTQIRSDTKLHVMDHSPSGGMHIKTADPSTAPASASFDPYKSAVTFFEHMIHPTGGHTQNSTSNGTTHSITNNHAAGPAMAAANGAHTIGANPLTGPLISAANGAHTIAASPTAGVAIASKIAHTFAAPNANLTAAGALSTIGSISAPSGSFGGFSFGGGGAAGSGSMSVTENLQAGQLLISGTFTVSQLNTMFPPASTAAGARAAVTDATSPTFLAVLTGSGTVVAPAFNNGVAWVCA